MTTPLLLDVPKTHMNWIQGDRFEYLSQVYIFDGNIGGHTMEAHKEGDNQPVYLPRETMKQWKAI